jgi:hypothetical protein
VCTWGLNVCHNLGKYLHKRVAGTRSRGAGVASNTVSYINKVDTVSAIAKKAASAEHFDAVGRDEALVQLASLYGIDVGHGALEGTLVTCAPIIISK